MVRNLLIVLLLYAPLANAQEVFPLYSGKVPGSEAWTWSEAEMYSDLWETRVVYNVSKPTLTAYIPAGKGAHRAAVIICPGGGFQALSIDTEGIDVAKWLNAKGITAFVLKYRLAKSETTDPVKELAAKMAQGKGLDDDGIISLAIADGLEAVRYLREHADEFGINPERIGILGFSAGGTVAAGVALRGVQESRADFVAPIYPFLPYSFSTEKTPEDAPPLFLAAASDDQLGLVPHSLKLYEKWLEAKMPVEMHLYAAGGHGFGMRTKYLPSDTWIDRYWEWLESQGLLLPPGARERDVTPQQVVRHRRGSEERFRNDWPNLRRFREANEELGPPKQGERRVVFMGNSITAGWSNLHPEFFENKPYVNRGISGQTTPQMLIRFKQDVIDLKPEVVVILAGINDIAQNTGPTTLDAIMDNIASMAMLAKANGIKVILSSVLPAYDFRWRPGLQPAEKVVELNKMIRRFADQNKMLYVDYFSAVVDARLGMKKEYASDEVHPTLEGYKVMEPLVERAIETALKSK